MILKASRGDRNTTCLFSVSRFAVNMELRDLSANSASYDQKMVVRRSDGNFEITGFGLFTLSSKPYNDADALSLPSPMGAAPTMTQFQKEQGRTPGNDSWEPRGQGS